MTAYKLGLLPDISIDSLTKLDAAMQEIRASMPPEPLKVEVAFVDGLVGICPVCKAEVHPYEPPQAQTRPPVSTETKDVSKTETSPPPKPSASNILEMRPRSINGGAPLTG